MPTEHLPGQLDLEDFIKMDVTRPLVASEIEEIHPQAVLDRSELTQRGIQSDSGDEQIGPRCPVCFGPRPCPKHENYHDQMPASYEHEPESGPVDAHAATTYPYEEPLAPNVTVMPGLTTHDVPVEEILRDAYNSNLVELVIVGVDKDGNEYVHRSTADAAAAVWHLTRGLHNINMEMDERAKEK